MIRALLHHMLHTDLNKWVARELAETRMEILKAEDDAQAAKLRLAALRDREKRLAVKATYTMRQAQPKGVDTDAVIREVMSVRNVLRRP